MKKGRIRYYSPTHVNIPARARRIETILQLSAIVLHICIYLAITLSEYIYIYMIMFVIAIITIIIFFYYYHYYYYYYYHYWLI